MVVVDQQDIGCYYPALWYSCIAQLTSRGDSRLDSGNHLLKRLPQLYESERHDAIDPASLYTPPWLSPRMPLLPHYKDRQTALHWQASLSGFRTTFSDPR